MGLLESRSKFPYYNLDKDGRPLNIIEVKTKVVVKRYQEIMVMMFISIIRRL